MKLKIMFIAILFLIGISMTMGQNYTAQYWLEKGNSSLASKNSSHEAINYFDKAIQINPDCQEAWIGKALALDHISRYNESLECINKSIDLDSRNAAAWGLKGNVLKYQHRYEEGLKCLNRSIELNPKDYKSWNDKGVIFHNMGLFNDSLKCYNMAAELDPKNHYWYSRAEVLERLGRNDEALVYINKAILESPENWNLWFEKYGILTKLNRNTEADEVLHRTKELRQQYPWQ